MIMSINPRLKRFLDTLSKNLTPEERKAEISKKCGYGWEPTEYEWGAEDIFKEIICPTVFVRDHKINEDAVYTCGFMIDIDDPQEYDMMTMVEGLNEAKLNYALIMTANYMKPKKGVTCERYRVYLPFDDVKEIAEDHKEKIHYWLTLHPLFKKYKIDKDGAGFHRYFFPTDNIVVVRGRCFVNYEKICSVTLPKTLEVAPKYDDAMTTHISKTVLDLIDTISPGNRSIVTCKIAGKCKHYTRELKLDVLNRCLNKGIDKACESSFRKYSGL